jgi:uncharacterized protein YktB (UPF0637 family)
MTTGYYNVRLEIVMDVFSAKDFKVFEIPGFAGRMQALRARIQPRLASIGESLAPRLSSLVDAPLYVHVARHLRRTVNPPDDTWVAFGRDRRGYKKDAHFRVSVSGRSVRLLFEAGPEYYAKSEWARGWTRLLPEIAGSLQKNGLGWFNDEHEDTQSKLLSKMDIKDLSALAKELTRRKDGQLVLGRSIAVEDFLRLSGRQFEDLALETFKPMVPLFGIYEPRVLASRAS